MSAYARVLRFASKSGVHFVRPQSVSYIGLRPSKKGIDPAVLFYERGHGESELVMRFETDEEAKRVYDEIDREMSRYILEVNGSEI